MSMSALLSVVVLGVAGARASLGAAELPHRDPQHDESDQRDHARLDERRHAPAEPRDARVERLAGGHG